MLVPANGCFSDFSVELKSSASEDGAMNKLIFISLTVVGAVFASTAQAQYGYAPPPGYGGAAGVPQYAPTPQYVPTPQYAPNVSPQSSPTLGRAAPGYQWREERAQGDWRNNTWREQQAKQNDYRANGWREQRTNEDWRGREDYAKQKTKNNAADRGYVECGVGAAGTSMPCREYLKERTKPTREERAAEVECGPNSVAESCRPKRSQRDDDDAESPAARRLNPTKKQNSQQ